MNEYLTLNNDQTFIAGDDFNTVLNPNLDKINGNSDTHKNAEKKILELIEQSNLTDIWTAIIQKLYNTPGTQIVNSSNSE